MRTITLPILAPAVLTALLAGFIRSLEAFEIEQLLGTPAGIQVFSTRVFEYIRFQPAQFPPALALSTFFLLVLFVLAFAYQWYTNEHRYASVTGRGVSFRPMPRERWHYIASAICFAMIFISVVIPMVMLVTGSLMRGFGFFNVPNPYTTLHWERVLRDPVFLRSISASLQLGFAASLGGLVLYSLLAYAIVRSRIWGRNVISLLSWLPWALPGLLLGLSLLWMILNVPGLNLLYGTVGGLVFALLVKDLPLGTQMMKTAFIQVAEELEQASRVCGAGWLRTFRAIMLPLVIPMMTSVFVWSFISSLRDISTVILLSSPSARPLSVLMMEFSISGNLEAATVVATIISATALAVALAVRRLGLRFGSELG
jgi:iron(III) transport system permease protein